VVGGKKAGLFYTAHQAVHLFGPLGASTYYNMQGLYADTDTGTEGSQVGPHTTFIYKAFIFAVLISITGQFE
jgi:hypothetical protein